MTLFSCQKEPVQLPPQTGDTTILNISYGESSAQKLDLYLPGGRTDTTPVIILIHGGGWSTGDKNELSFFGKGFKERGFAVANINYRLSPQSDDNYNMQLDDIEAVKQFLINHAGKYSYSSKRFYTTGHSAGAHLSLSYAYTRNGDHLVKAAAGMATPANLWNMAYYNPVVYAQLLTPYLGTPLTSSTSDRYTSASPYYQATSTSVPTILFHAIGDVFVNQDQSINMDNKLKQLGVDEKLILYPWLSHDWWTNGDFVKNTLDETSRWFRNH